MRPDSPVEADGEQTPEPRGGVKVSAGTGGAGAKRSDATLTPSTGLARRVNVLSIVVTPAVQQTRINLSFDSARSRPLSKMEQKPVMSPDERRFMAFEGLFQWTHAVVSQTARVSGAQQTLVAALRQPSLGGSTAQSALARRLVSHDFQTECHYFAISAFKLIEFRDWAISEGSCPSVDFSCLAAFSLQDIRDLRDMREHVVDYFRGQGHRLARWNKTTADFKADASSVDGSNIGGRVDWVALGAAAGLLLNQLLALPVPFPPVSASSPTLPPHP